MHAQLPVAAQPRGSSERPPELGSLEAPAAALRVEKGWGPVGFTPGKPGSVSADLGATLPAHCPENPAWAAGLAEH